MAQTSSRVTDSTDFSMLLNIATMHLVLQMDPSGEDEDHKGHSCYTLACSNFEYFQVCVVYRYVMTTL